MLSLFSELQSLHVYQDDYLKASKRENRSGEGSLFLKKTHGGPSFMKLHNLPCVLDSLKI